eukprot:GEMP01005279.1.p1 GENE.GEMP01005279.1~~GEMP01005279.1.p1  ORF type:complete len:896 (+),score=118.73 GEMP01005279.1:36-2690(+)
MASPVVEGRIAPWEQFVHQCKYGFVRFHHNVQNIMHLFQTMGPQELAEAFPPPNIVYLLGRRHVLNQPGLEEFMRDWSKIYRMTYRQGFASMYRQVAPQEHITLTGDAGWGCMIRVAQMMIALALRRTSSLEEGRLLSWFLDVKSAPFGIFQFVHAAGAVDRMDKLHSIRRPAGDWFGPTTVSYAIQKLIALLGGHMQVYVNADSVIFQDVVCALGKYEPRSWRDRKMSQAQSACSNASSCATPRDDRDGFNWVASPSVRPDAPLWTLPDRDARLWTLPDQEASWNFEPTEDAEAEDKADAWTRSVLILLPLQLSIDATAPRGIARKLTKYLEIPQSIGILGGRPRVAYFIVGCVGETLLYVDPHCVQDAATSARHFSSFQNDPSRHIGTMKLEHLESSASVAFLCRSQQEFDSLCESLAAPELDLISVERTMHIMNPDPNEIICIEDNLLAKSSFTDAFGAERHGSHFTLTGSWDFALEPGADVVTLNGSPSVASQEFVVLSDDESPSKRDRDLDAMLARDRYEANDPDKCQFIMVTDTKQDDSSDFLYLGEATSTVAPEESDLSPLRVTDVIENYVHRRGVSSPHQLIRTPERQSSPLQTFRTPERRDGPRVVESPQSSGISPQTVVQSVADAFVTGLSAAISSSGEFFAASSTEQRPLEAPGGHPLGYAPAASSTRQHPSCYAATSDNTVEYPFMHVSATRNAEYDPMGQSTAVNSVERSPTPLSGMGFSRLSETTSRTNRASPSDALPSTGPSTLLRSCVRTDVELSPAFDHTQSLTTTIRPISYSQSAKNMVGQQDAEGAADDIYTVPYPFRDAPVEIGQRGNMVLPAYRRDTGARGRGHFEDVGERKRRVVNGVLPAGMGKRAFPPCEIVRQRSAVSI